MLLRLAQEISRYAVPRGLPRAVWWLRRFMAPRPRGIVPYRDLFRMYCEPDSYPSLMAACGFVYHRMERVLDVLLSSGATFVDAGANVGFVTLLACGIGRANGIRVHAHCFEPDPNAFTWLVKNRELNGDRFDIVLNPCALGGTESEGDLTISARSGWSTMAPEPPEGFSFLPKAGTTRVRVTTLDRYCSERSLSPSVVKIDVEGFECELLDGARAVLERARPYIVIEVNPLRLAAAGTTGESLLARLAGSRYGLFHIDPRAARTPGSGARRAWRRLPEVHADDLVMGRDFDVLGIPEESFATTAAGRL